MTEPTVGSPKNPRHFRARVNNRALLGVMLVDALRGWSDTSYYSLPARGFVPGPALVTVFTNGIPSDAKYLIVPQ